MRYKISAINHVVNRDPRSEFNLCICSNREDREFISDDIDNYSGSGSSIADCLYYSH